ncbi:MAG: hypothetical protein QN141_06485 [Armatimonadota bacterium]|nr:hypothetical protein [Armatimonadota bacterium]MDR7452359.1 hypothetical protein [Armatimonadota bacterium]MDR7466919.1 hypothetical protein [Armatimonadota bacterium]MDR7493539.1 hypothetical protein [Armatimonadota bacterium]MDR7498804.1 hypothetical protein [Armatimonadota bacterium]
MRLLSIVAAFVLALGALSRGWAALRRAWAQPTPEAAAATLLYALVFVLMFLYLGFWVYRADRAAGKVVRTIGLYERILRRREGRVG